MKAFEETFELAIAEDLSDDGQCHSESKRVTNAVDRVPLGAATAHFVGFDRDDHPLVRGVPNLPHEIIVARTTVPLVSSQVGMTVVLVFEQGDPRRPIVVGVLQERRSSSIATERTEFVSTQTNDRLELSAEREIVLRCGDASITLTRAGKVLIKGAYIVSRSSGCNRIKGASVDIN